MRLLGQLLITAIVCALLSGLFAIFILIGTGRLH